MNGVRMSVSVSNRLVTGGSRLDLSIQITNGSKKTIVVYDGDGLGTRPDCTIELTNASGRASKVTPDRDIFGFLYSSAYIDPGQIHEWHGPLRIKKDIEPGSYTMKTGGLQILEYDEEHWFQISANEVSIEVKPPPVLGPADASKITLLEWFPGSAEPSDSFATRVESLKDKPLRAEDLLGLMTNVSFNPKARGFDLIASRDADLTGVSLTVNLDNGPGMFYGHWHFKEHVALGGQVIHDTSGSEEAGVYPSGIISDFTNAVQKATSAPPQTPFEIRVFIRAGAGAGN